MATRDLNQHSGAAAQTILRREAATAGVVSNGGLERDASGEAKAVWPQDVGSMLSLEDRRGALRAAGADL
eukprot:2598520-Prymnesium_polylepis.1